MKLYAYWFNGGYKLFTDIYVAMDERVKDKEKFPNKTGDLTFSVFVDTSKHPNSEEDRP